MECLSELQRVFFLMRMGLGSFKACIHWAMQRLLLDQEGGDVDVVLLAGASKEGEVLERVPRIIERYGGPKITDDHFIAGKYIAALHADYLGKIETIESLDAKLTKLFVRLGYPDWLVMLTRNCEYATDVDVFREPFERELKYVGELWSRAADRSDFEAVYDRAVSNQHDVFPTG
jgi:hypothetical protein